MQSQYEFTLPRSMIKWMQNFNKGFRNHIHLEVTCFKQSTQVYNAQAKLGKIWKPSSHEANYFASGGGWGWGWGWEVSWRKLYLANSLKFRTTPTAHAVCYTAPTVTNFQQPPETNVRATQIVHETWIQGKNRSMTQTWFQQKWVKSFSSILNIQHRCMSYMLQWLCKSLLISQLSSWEGKLNIAFSVEL